MSVWKNGITYTHEGMINLKGKDAKRLLHMSITPENLLGAWQTETNMHFDKDTGIRVNSKGVPIDGSLFSINLKSIKEI